MSGSLIAADLAGLEKRDAEALAAIWRRHLRERVPNHLPKALLVRVLAHRLQCELLGGLSKRATTFLAEIERDLRAGRDPAVSLIVEKQLRPGTLLVREHDGVMHRVMVMEGAFAWEGKNFPSLSAVAKAITGTNWNGHRFFELKAKREEKTEA